MKRYQSLFGVLVFLLASTNQAHGQALDITQSITQIADTSAQPDFSKIQKLAVKLKSIFSKSLSEKDPQVLKVITQKSNRVYRGMSTANYDQLHWKQKLYLLIACENTRGDTQNFSKAITPFTQDKNQAIRYMAMKNIAKFASHVKLSPNDQKFLDKIIQKRAKKESVMMINRWILNAAIQIGSPASRIVALQLFDKKLNAFTKNPRINIKPQIIEILKLSTKISQNASFNKPTQKFLKLYLKTITKYIKVCSNASREKDFFKRSEITYYKNSSYKIAQWIKAFVPMFDKNAPVFKLPSSNRVNHIESFLIDHCRFSQDDFEVGEIMIPRTKR